MSGLKEYPCQQLRGGTGVSIYENVDGLCSHPECEPEKDQEMKIPKKFQLFGTTVNVVFDNKRCNDKSVYGLFDYSKSEITMSTVEGVESISEDKIMDTFYHERTHAILNAMHEDELSSNEKFVDVFSKLLRQAIESEDF